MAPALAAGVLGARSSGRLVGDISLKGSVAASAAGFVGGYPRTPGPMSGNITLARLLNISYGSFSRLRRGIKTPTP